MALVPENPFRDLDNFFNEDLDVMPMVPFRGNRLPEVDVYQTDKNVVAEVSLAGFKPEEIDISVEGNVLNIKGEKEEKKEQGKKGKEYYRKEIRKGSFERAVRLPVEVKGEKAEAEFNEGILKITLPKAEEKKAKKIQVKSK